MIGKRRIRVLMILNNAPDYREPFLRELAKTVDLSVVARPCEADQLTPPSERIGYTYRELPVRRVGALLWQPGLSDALRSEEWDVICSSINLRDIGRTHSFFRFHNLQRRWVWWGHIFGKTAFPGLSILRRLVMERAAGALVFNDEIAERVRSRYKLVTKSFNNTQVRSSDFRSPVFRDMSDGTVRLLFVGRFQPRKELHRLVKLAERKRTVLVRFVGPGMDSLVVPDALVRDSRVQVFGRTVGAELNQHFDWADLVANPGHVGLLVMNAAQHGKGIVIDSSSRHAPEYLLAQEANQPFIDFSNPDAVDAFVDNLRTAEEPNHLTRVWAGRLQKAARDRYTIEHMAAVHVEVFRSVIDRLDHSLDGPRNDGPNRSVRP